MADESPKGFDAGVRPQGGIARQQSHFFRKTLGHEQTIEGIPMEKRKVEGATNVGPGDGQGLSDAAVDPFFPETFQPTEELKFFERHFDGQLPKGGLADPEIVRGTFQSLACRWGEGGILVAVPKEGVPVDEQSQRMYSLKSSKGASKSLAMWRTVPLP